MKTLLLILLLASPVFAGGPKSTFPQPRGLDDEVRNLYHDIANPVINIGSASTMTVTQLNVSSVTMTGALNTSNLIASSGTIKSFMVVGDPIGTSAPKGRLGEIVSSVATATFTTGVTNNITSISLTSGNWIIFGSVFFHTTSTLTSAAAQVGTTSATLDGTQGVNRADVGTTTGGDSGVFVSVSASISVTTTYYLIAILNGAGTLSGGGQIIAIRYS